MTFSLLTRRTLGLAALVVVLGAVGWVLARNGPLAPVPVTAEAVRQGTVHPGVFGIGTVEARRSWVVGPTATGRVQQVWVDVGDAVSPGQLLAEMDPVDMDARVGALDASLARALSAQAAARAQVADARARRELAAGNLRRNEDLASQDFISAGALQGRQQELASASAAADAAQANLAAAAQDHDRLRAERQALLSQRNNTRLLAPAAGVVTSRDAEPGSTVVAGQAVLRLVDPASLWVRARVDQGRAAGLAVGKPAEVVLRSSPGAPVSAHVARLELLADAVTEERLVLLTLDTRPTGLSVGEMAEVTVRLPAPAPGLVVPNASLQREAGRTGVWRLTDGDRLQWVPVAVVATGLDGGVRVQNAGQTVAPEGTATGAAPALAEGDRVVVHSLKPVQAGTRVRVVPSLVKAGGAAAPGAGAVGGHS